MQNFKKNIPNIITIIRILFVIPIVCLLLWLNSNKAICTFYINDVILEIKTNYVIVLALFAIASFSDFLDGFLARKMQVVSNLGKILDPIADKILINSIYIILAAQNNILLPLVIIMVIRDIFIDAVRIDASARKIIVPASWYGKAKTVLQMISIIFVLLMSTNTTNWWFYGIQNLFAYVATIMSVYSLVDYVFKYRQSIKTENKIEKN